MTRRRNLVGALVLIALAFITLDFRETGGPVGALQRGADAVFAPVQGGFVAVTDPFTNFFGSIFEIGTLRSRIETLEADNAQLREDLRVQADLERRLAEAESLLNMSPEQPLNLVGARVIAAPPGNFERSVVIDVGTEQGVLPTMAVMNSRGVVGIVVEATRTRARVNLISSTEFGLAVRVARSGDRGILSGQGSGLLQVEMLAADPDVQIDDTYVTQTFQGSLIPSGLPVGVLEPPADGDPEGERFLEVRPFADVGSLTTVAVVVSAPEADGEFEPGETVDVDGLVDAPTVTFQPNPDLPALPEGVTTPSPQPGVSASPSPGASPAPTASPGAGGSPPPTEGG